MISIGVKLSNLQSILDFMYHGEVNLAQEDLNLFLEVAEELKVKGLTQKQSSQMPESRVAIQPREQEASPGPDLNSNSRKPPPTSVLKPKRQLVPHIEDDTGLQFGSVKSVPDEEPLYLQPWSGDPETEEQHYDDTLLQFGSEAALDQAHLTTLQSWTRDDTEEQHDNTEEHYDNTEKQYEVEDIGQYEVEGYGAEHGEDGNGG